MAREGAPRARGLAAGFAGYFVLAAILAYVLASPISGYDAPGYIRWLLTAYVLLGAVVLVGVSVGAVARANALEASLESLESEENAALDRGRRAAAAANVPPPPPDPMPMSEPTDADVEQLLVDLQDIGQLAAEHAREPEPGLHSTADLRLVAGEMDRLRQLRRAVAAHAAGPAIASAALIGVFASLLPASDGMLTDVWMNTFVGLAGVLGLLGVAAYTGVAFRRLRMRA